MANWRKYRARALEAALIIAVLIAIYAYQTRSLLDADREPAPDLTLTTLQGNDYRLAEHAGKPALVYFFAPWCPYCSASADNLVRLRQWRERDRLEIVVVALDWASRQEVIDYADRHGLNVPVLLGDASVAAAWRVYGFPIYYVLDSEHRVVWRDFGYSSQFGLWWRSWFVK